MERKGMALVYWEKSVIYMLLRWILVVGQIAARSFKGVMNDPSCEQTESTSSDLG